MMLNMSDASQTDKLIDTVDIVSSTSNILAGLAGDMLRQTMPPATLYVLATPIGNRADVTVRAVFALHLADCVAAEDTRVAGHWLHSLGLHKPLLVCDTHREQAAAQTLIERLAQGQRVVLCSDAGTPAISDPGARVVAAVRAAGYRVLPIPGVSALTTAISAGGLVDEAFTFHAFAPSKGKERSDFYTALCASPTPQVWFEAPHRMGDCLAQLAALTPQRKLCIARELTKQFEDIVTLPCEQALTWFNSKPERSKGEFVLTLAVQPVVAMAQADVHALALAQLLVTELPASKAAALAAKHYGAERSAVYQALLDAKPR